MYPGNTPLVTLVALVLAVLGPGFASAQPLSAPADEPPCLTETVEAYGLLEPWVRALAVPEGATGPEVVGACVTLRFEGRVVGLGTIFGAGAQSIPSAAAIAIVQAREKLPITRDAMAEERLRLAAQQLTISLELAGPAVPIASRGAEDLIAQFSPGVHGVALRMNDLAAAVYPGEMLWTSQDVPGAVRRLIAGVTGDAALAMRPIEEVLPAAKIDLLRFRARHIAQLAPGEEPRLLQRGGRVVQSTEVRSMPSLREWADGLGEFLIEHRDVGVFLPVSGTVRSAPSPLQRALRMHALLGIGELTGDSDLATNAINEASHEAVEIIKAYNAREPLGAAVISILAVSLKSDALNEPARVRTTEIIVAELSRLASDIESVPVPERPMVAWALAKLAMFDEARAVMPLCRRASHPGMLVEQMPWLGFAELELVGADGVPSAPGLREMRSLLWRQQINLGDTDATSGDLVGGIVFTRSLTKLPTWQAARPLAFMGPMLAEPSLTTTEELPGEMARLFESLRFLRQLSAGPHEGHMYASGGAWQWGVRPATWDQSMPIEASAMTLICVTETIRSLERLEARLKPTEPAESDPEIAPE